MQAKDSEAGRTLTKTRHAGIYRRGERYVVRFRDGQGRQRQRSARTLAEARKVRAAVTADVARGEHRELSRITFAAYAGDWIAGYQGRTGKGTRYETRRRYARDLEHEAIPYFGRLRLVEVEPAHVRAFALHLAGPRALAPATVRNYLAPVRALFATAHEDGHIRHNPCASLRLPGGAAEPVVALSEQELARLLAATPEGPGRLLLGFLADTGLRIGEALVLRWRNLDLPAQRVRVESRIYRGREAPPKSHYGRRAVPLSAGLAAELRRHRLASPHSGEDDHVFASAAGTCHAPENLYRRVLRPAAERAGLGVFGFHSLRHTAASRLLRAGVSPKQLQIVLGHHSPAFTLAIYAHLLPSDLPDVDFLDAARGVNAGVNTTT